jgi:hypothetical protein
MRLILVLYTILFAVFIIEENVIKRLYIITKNEKYASIIM